MYINRYYYPIIVFECFMLSSSSTVSNRKILKAEKTVHLMISMTLSDDHSNNKNPG